MHYALTKYPAYFFLRRAEKLVLSDPVFRQDDSYFLGYDESFDSVMKKTTRFAELVRKNNIVDRRELVYVRRCVSSYRLIFLSVLYSLLPFSDACDWRCIRQDYQRRVDSYLTYRNVHSYNRGTGWILMRSVCSLIISCKTDHDARYSGFVPFVRQSQGTEEQKAKWLPLARNFNITGSYAQTELGHGKRMGCYLFKMHCLGNKVLSPLFFISY